MATNWQQLGPVHAKVVGDKTLVTRLAKRAGWGVDVHTAEGVEAITFWKDTEAEAMAAADAIYDPPKKKIEAKDRGPDWSFWKSEDGTKFAVCYQWCKTPAWYCTSQDFDKYCNTQADAELAAAKYVGGEG